MEAFLKFYSGWSQKIRDDVEVHGRDIMLRRLDELDAAIQALIYRDKVRNSAKKDIKDGPR